MVFLNAEGNFKIVLFKLLFCKGKRVDLHAQRGYPVR